MISKDKKYCTRDGREVRIYATDCGIAEPVHGAIKTGNNWSMVVWNNDGKYASTIDTIADLVEVKQENAVKTEAYTKAEEDLYKALGNLPINDTFRGSASVNVVLAIRAMIDEALLKDKAISVNNADALVKDVKND